MFTPCVRQQNERVGVLMHMHSCASYQQSVAMHLINNQRNSFTEIYRVSFPSHLIYLSKHSTAQDRLARGSYSQLAGAPSLRCRAPRVRYTHTMHTYIHTYDTTHIYDSYSTAWVRRAACPAAAVAAGLVAGSRCALSAC
jgi:hypothetical protein